jgi:uncharacterized protein DUF3800
MTTIEPRSTPFLNIYCDESCHLEVDHQEAMVLGALWLPTGSARAASQAIRDIKTKHHLSPNFEIKWTKVSPGGLAFYLELVDYFFSDSQLRLRAVVATGKSKLNHEAFEQTHDDWYYKMYFTLLRPLIHPGSRYRIYLDIKDTRGGPKTRRLREILSNAIHDFDLLTIEQLQIVRSEQVEVLQLADLLVGAIGAVNRGQLKSPAKTTLAKRIALGAARPLDQTTPLGEEKLNLLRWTPQVAS